MAAFREAKVPLSHAWYRSAMVGCRIVIYGAVPLR